MTDQRLEHDLRSWMDATAPITPQPALMRASMDRIAATSQVTPWRRWVDGWLGGARHVRAPRRQGRAILTMTLVVATAATGAVLLGRVPGPSRPASWRIAAAPQHARHQAAMVATPDGAVLLLAGQTSDAAGAPVKAIERWDPTSESWSTIGALPGAWAYPAAVTLADGMVLLVDLALPPNGGEPSSEVARLVDPATGQSVAVGGPRTAHTHGIGGAGWRAMMDPMLVPLRGGGAVMLGGVPGQSDGESDGATQPMAEVWDPVTRDFSVTEPLPCDASRGAAAPLPDGSALIVCSLWYTGEDHMDARLREPLWEPAAAILDPRTGRSVSVPAPTTMNVGAATALTDGRVLLTGPAIAGVDDPAEIRDRDGTYRRLSVPENPVVSSVVTPLTDGRVLFVDPWSPIALVFDPATETFHDLTLPAPLAYGSVAPLAGGRALIVFGPDWETPGPRRDQPAPIVVEPGS